MMAKVKMVKCTGAGSHPRCNHCPHTTEHTVCLVVDDCSNAELRGRLGYALYPCSRKTWCSQLLKVRCVAVKPKTKEPT